MKQPEHILETGTRVITNDLRSYPLSGVRRKNAPGKINGVVGGMGGDVYCVEHDDGTRGAYCFDEFELEEPQREASKTIIPDANAAWHQLVVLWGQENTFGLGQVANTTDGQSAKITWQEQSSVVQLAAETINGDAVICLDLTGIAKLRVALDKAEAAWRERIKTQANDAVAKLDPLTQTVVDWRIRATRTAPHEPNPVEQAYQYPDPPPPGPGMRDIVFERRPMDIVPSEQQVAALKAAIGEREHVAPPTPQPDYRCMTIGDRIRLARRKAKLTLEDTSKVMGCSIPHASDIERHNTLPTEAEVQALAKLFGVTVEDLKG